MKFIRALPLLLVLCLCSLMPNKADACASCVPGGDYGPICNYNWLGSEWCHNNAGQCVSGGGFCVIFIEGVGKKPRSTVANAENSIVSASTVYGPPDPAPGMSESNQTIEEAYRECMAQPGCTFMADSVQMARLRSKFSTWGTLAMLAR